MSLLFENSFASRREFGVFIILAHIRGFLKRFRRGEDAVPRGVSIRISGFIHAAFNNTFHKIFLAYCVLIRVQLS